MRTRTSPRTRMFIFPSSIAIACSIVPSVPIAWIGGASK
jgi:hypothetical protein